jgi:hypothetical protein
LELDLVVAVGVCGGGLFDGSLGVHLLVLVPEKAPESEHAGAGGFHVWAARQRRDSGDGCVSFNLGEWKFDGKALWQ